MIPMQLGYEDTIGERLIDGSVKRRMHKLAKLAGYLTPRALKDTLQEVMLKVHTVWFTEMVALQGCWAFSSPIDKL